MLQQFTTEGVISLAFSLSLLGSFLCFLKFLADANLRAWSNIRKDKALARRRRASRTPESELLGNAWFGGPCGLLAMVVEWHKVRKPLFVGGYLCRSLTGAGVCLLVFLLYLVLALPHTVAHWSSAKDLMLHFLEWSKQLRSVLLF
jgi:uncharacterized membrane protein YsdA (DUF1294 family)